MSLGARRLPVRFAGTGFGLLGVVGFSFTLPATRLAVASLDPVVVGLGRGLVAACLAAPLLLATRQPRPRVRQCCSLALVIAGVIIGFPMLSAWAMQHVPASHGAVVLGLLPIATAAASVLRTDERPTLGFWASSALGSVAVLGFALSSGGGAFHPADIALIAAVILAAVGYAEGGRLARELGGWQVICWALVLAAPLLIIPVAIALGRHGYAATASASAGFAYLSVISAFLAFFAWYHGLATGGIARVSQVQLLQPFITLAFAALALGERPAITDVAAATLVVASVFCSQRSQTEKKVVPPCPNSFARSSID